MTKSVILSLALSLVLSLSVYADDSSSLEKSDKKVGSVLFLLNPAKAEIKTGYTPETMVNLIDEYRRRALNGEFKELGINTGFIEMDVKKDKAKLTFFTSSFGALTKAMRVKVSPEGDENKLVVKARIPYCQMKNLYQNKDQFALSGKRWRFSNEVEKRLEGLLDL